METAPGAERPSNGVVDEKSVETQAPESSSRDALDAPMTEEHHETDGAESAPAELVGKETDDHSASVDTGSEVSKRTFDQVELTEPDSLSKKYKHDSLEEEKPIEVTSETNENDTIATEVTEDPMDENTEKHDSDADAESLNQPIQEASDRESSKTDAVSSTAEVDTRENTDPALLDGTEAIGTSSESNPELKMIVNQLTEAADDGASDESDSESRKGKMVVLDGLEVPADSELLNTSKAFAAYSSFSNHLPAIPTVAGAVSGVHLAALPLPIVCPDYLPPRIQLLVNTLPTLDNLATQLLRIVVVGPYQKIIELASNQDTPAGATFRDLMSMFEITKKLYAEEDPFLTVEHVAPGMWKEGDPTPKIFRSREQSIESTLRKVNLATFLMATLGATEVGFFYLNESFLNIFCPYNSIDPGNAFANVDLDMSLQSGVNTIIGDKVGKMYRPQATLFLELKTQAYISAIEAGERSSEEILEEIFPSNLEEYLIYRRGVNHLSLVEEDFISRCLTRRQLLLSFPSDRNLSEEYDWFAFLKELFNYVSKNMGFIILGKGGKNIKLRTSLTAQSQKLLNSVEGTTAREKLEYLQKHNAFAPASSSSISLSALDKSRKRKKGDSVSDKNETTEKITDVAAIDESSRDAVMDKYQNSGTEFNDKDVNDITKTLLPSEIKERQLHVRINPGITKTYSRQLWTREEEKALRDALELKGPAWSAILELFGKGGKINESLKNRNQVQLKDKARNMKVFFLKNMLPVPEYLQNVTGGLDREEKGKRSTRIKGTSKTAAAPVPNLTHNEQH